MYSISQQIIVVCRVAKVYLGKLKNFNSLGMGRHNLDSSFKCLYSNKVMPPHAQTIEIVELTKLARETFATSADRSNIIFY